MTHATLRFIPSGTRSLASWVFVSLAAASAAFAEDTCDSNADCPAGYQCETFDVTISCPPPAPDCQGDECNTNCDGDESAREDSASGVCIEIPPGCTSDADCDEGFVCIAAPIACSPPDCPEGPEGDACRDADDCDDVVSQGYCLEDFGPEDCDTDADCGEGEVCERFVSEACVGAVSPCAEDAAGNVQCDDPPMGPDEECTVVEYAQCIPRYASSCDVDTDCGPGFTCEAAEICVCSGSAGAMEGSGDDGENASEQENLEQQEEECSCEPSDELYCVLQDLPCESNEECPTGLTCELVSADSGSCSIDSDGNLICPDDQREPVPNGKCVPPGYNPDFTPAGPNDAVDSGPATPEEDPSVGGDGTDAGDTGYTDDTDAEDPNDTGDTDDTDGKSFFLSCASTGTDPSLFAFALLVFGLAHRRRS